MAAKNDRRSNLGIAGLDANKRTRQARLAIAGEIKGKTAAAARMGIAGNLAGIETATSLRRYDRRFSEITLKSKRLGDTAARTAWQRGVWFASFEYITKLVGGRIAWKRGREVLFGRQFREIPLFLDSAGYRREIARTAPRWTHNFHNYPAAIELVRPDGYAWFDYPNDRRRTLETGREMMRIFSGDERMWPVFSVRWPWHDRAHLDLGALPAGWSSSDLSYLIPLNSTQRQFKPATRDRWARQAIANAMVTAQDPDFRWMVDAFGQVMIGGMVRGPCNRLARHLYAATLCRIFPGVQFWLLGQANFAVVNGLGRLGLLDRVWVDGTWWIKDSTAERFAVVRDGLITMMHVSPEQERRAQTFFSLPEMMAANLRSLLSAYRALWTWPPPEPLPVDLMDIDQVQELKSRLKATQLELGL
jgi:hypothetical protein